MVACFRMSSTSVDSFQLQVVRPLACWVVIRHARMQALPLALAPPRHVARLALSPLLEHVAALVRLRLFRWSVFPYLFCLLCLAVAAAMVMDISIVLVKPGVTVSTLLAQVSDADKSVVISAYMADLEDSGFSTSGISLSVTSTVASELVPSVSFLLTFSMQFAPLSVLEAQEVRAPLKACVESMLVRSMACSSVRRLRS